MPFCSLCSVDAFIQIGVSFIDGTTKSVTECTDTMATLATVIQNFSDGLVNTSNEYVLRQQSVNGKLDALSKTFTINGTIYKDVFAISRDELHGILVDQIEREQRFLSAFQSKSFTQGNSQYLPVQDIEYGSILNEWATLPDLMLNVTIPFSPEYGVATTQNAENIKAANLALSASYHDAVMSIDNTTFTLEQAKALSLTLGIITSTFEPERKLRIRTLATKYLSAKLTHDDLVSSMHFLSSASSTGHFSSTNDLINSGNAITSKRISAIHKTIQNALIRQLISIKETRLANKLNTN